MQILCRGEETSSSLKAEVRTGMLTTREESVANGAGPSPQIRQLDRLPHTRKNFGLEIRHILIPAARPGLPPLPLVGNQAWYRTSLSNTENVTGFWVCSQSLNW